MQTRRTGRRYESLIMKCNDEFARVSYSGLDSSLVCLQSGFEDC